MKKIFYFFLIICIFSCSETIEKPKNLLPKDAMAELLAEFTINDQLSYISPVANQDASTKYILKKYHIKGEDFIKSYEYYLITNDLRSIYKKAQKIVVEKDPEAKAFIEKKNNPAVAR